MKVNRLLLVLIFAIAGLLNRSWLSAQSLTIEATYSNNCSSTNNGAIYLVIAGGEPPYFISVNGYNDGDAFGYIDTLSQLAPGPYALMVTDEYGDTGYSNQYIVQGPFISITYNIVHHIGCLDTVIVTPSPPSGSFFSYWYSWIPGEYGDSIEPICGGQTEILTITDINAGCNDTFHVTDTYSPFNFFDTILKYPCTGGCDGKAMVKGTTGVPPYSYTWQTWPPQYTDTAINLCPGTYQVQIVDSTNLTATATVTIIEPFPMVVSIDYVTYGNCHDSAFGIVKGGVPPYLYKWNSHPASGNYSFANICLGEHDTLTVTDASGCNGAIVCYAIDSGLPASAPACYSFSNYIVPEDSQQQAFYYYGDGNPGFLQNWYIPNGTPSIETSEQSILPYDGAAQFALMGICSFSDTFSEGLELAYNFDQGSSYKVSMALVTLDAEDGPNPIDVQFILIQDTIPYVYGSYSGGCTPTAHIPPGALIIDSLVNYDDTAWKVYSFNINHLTSSYSYLWIREQLPQDAQQIDTYLMLDSFCVQRISPVSLALTADAKVVNTIMCRGNCNGSAAVAATGGTPPYSYIWNTSPKQTTDTATNLCAGAYTVMVYDNVHDSTSAMVTLSQPALIHDSVQITICSGQSYQGRNATGTYNDTLTAANGCDSIVTLILVVNSSPVNHVQQQMCMGDTFQGHTLAGVYTDTISFAGGCDSVVVLNLSLFPAATSSISDTICFGQSYLGHDSPGVYIDTLYGASANGCDSIHILNLTVQSITTGLTKLRICRGDTFEGHTTAGTYYDTIHTSGGCDTIITLELQIDTLPDYVPISQSGDTLFTLSGFQQYSWYLDSAMLLYTGTDSFYVISHSGNYYVTISNDPQFCVKRSAEIIAYLTGIGQLTSDTEHIIIYPNPGDGLFYLQVKGNEPVQNITVLNALGQIVFFQAYKQKTVTPLLKVDCGNQAAGIYFMKIHTADELITKPVMIR